MALTMPHTPATANDPHRIQTGKKRFMAISSLHTKDSVLSVTQRSPFYSRSSSPDVKFIGRIPSAIMAVSVASGVNRAVTVSSPSVSVSR